MIASEKNTESDFYEIDGDTRKLDITCAGMPKGCYQYVTYDNFRVGTEYDGKLRPVMSKKGTVLEKCTFTIRQ